MSHPFDMVCLSHLRWNFVFQRPQHLLSRAARERRVLYVEEPVFGEGPAHWDVSVSPEGVSVAVPHLPHEVEAERALRPMLDELLNNQNMRHYALWYYTPMARAWSDHLVPLATVYDCMDELSAFRGAPPELLAHEAELLSHADIVFTGGQSLYEAKQGRANHVYLFPSSVDVAHFASARQDVSEPDDQTNIAHPRLGFFGVIDERFDVELLRAVAALRPQWQWVMLGPVVKISPESLPQGANIHYLGGKNYKDLPAYLSGWDVALLLFAHNESTRFISPTKTPEYLASGCPVVSTSIRDVVRPYGEQALVWIADTPEDFIAACEQAIHEESTARQQKVDAFLSTMSWDSTWRQMQDLIDTAIQERNVAPQQ